MKWSLVIPGSVSEQLADAARLAEEGGLHRVWTTESPGRDAILRSLHLLEVTTTLRGGTGIAFAFTRPPLAAAGSAADAFHLSGGRFSLGLGAGTRGQRRWFRQEFDHPAPRFADYVRALKAVLRSQGYVRYEGPFYEISAPQVQLPASPEALAGLKIFGGGLHEHMLQAIGRSCDGLVLHPLAGNAGYLDDVVLPSLDAVKPDSGTRPELVIWCPVSIDEDADKARQRAAEQLAFYFSTPSYADVAAHAGFGSVAAGLVERFNNGTNRPSFADLVPLVPEEMLRTFVVHGTPSEVAEQLAHRAEAWSARRVSEVSLQLSSHDVTAADLVTNVAQLSAIVGRLSDAAASLAG